MSASIQNDSSSIVVNITILFIMNPSQLNSSSMAQQKYKVVLLGDSGVGKSSLIDRFVKGEIDSQNQPTVGIDFLSKNLAYHGKTYKLQLWDTAGQQKYKSLVPAYLKDANCGILVFQTYRSETFQNLKSWLSLLRDHAPPHTVFIMVANKSDLQQLGNCEYKDEVCKFQLQQQIELVETSAKTGENVQKVFELIIQKLQKDKPQVVSKQQGQNDNEDKAVSDFFIRYNRTDFDYSRKLRCCHI